MILSALRRLPAAALCALAALLAACSGSPGPSPNVVDSTAITVQPGSATIYPGVEITLLITGGTGSYLVASNNQTIVPIVTTTAVGHQLRVIANPVSADTTVLLTVRDTSTTPMATVTLTVRPGTIANAVTIVPSSNACEPAICSGGDALVTATISQGGIPIASRPVRFDVISGDVRFIVTPPGTTGESLALTTTTTADQLGQARARLRVLANAPDQTALIQITDPDTGSFQRIAVNIRQFTGTGNASFFAVPDSITFTGPFIGQCATNAVTDVVIFGGTPPYNVVNANGVIAVTPPVVTQSGGTFRAQTVSSACFTDAPITITDAAGRTIIVRVTNREGTQPAPAPAVQLSPASITLGCGQSGSFVINGGTPPFSAGSSNPLVTAAPPVDRTVTVTRAGPAGSGTGTTSATISVTDGVTVDRATVTAPATCP